MAVYRYIYRLARVLKSKMKCFPADFLSNIRGETVSGLVWDRCLSQSCGVNGSM